MIEEYWGLQRKPFANSPDPAFVFHSPAFDEGFARLLYDVTEIRGGLSLVTGEIGCGKTMLAHALVARLDRRVAFSMSVVDRELFIAIGADNLSGAVARLHLDG